MTKGSIRKLARRGGVKVSRKLGDPDLSLGSTKTSILSTLSVSLRNSASPA